MIPVPYQWNFALSGMSVQEQERWTGKISCMCGKENISTHGNRTILTQVDIN